jgi:phenylacetate 2-hydroxylase
MEEKVPYLTAVYKEMLRYYAVAPFAAPHEAVRDVAYENTVIPKGTIVYFNVECANHDPGFYGQDAHVFRPERWLEEGPLAQKPSTGHFSYGIGARICPALNISNHVLHGLLMRLVLDFKIVADETALPNTDPIHYGNGMDSVNKAPSPFRVFFIPRDRAALAARLGVEASEMLG